MNEAARQNISFEEFELDTVHHRLLRKGKPVALYSKTFKLLAFLVENSGRVLSKDEILEAVWEGQIVEEANLSVQISTLRKVLEEKKDSPRFLVTVPGMGYKFVADINQSAGEIIIEKQKFSRISVEQEVIHSENSDKIGKFLNRNKIFLVGGAVSVLILLVGTFGFYRNSNLKKSAVPFETAKLKRLTNSGLIECVAISPDGKYLAYVLSGSHGNSLRLSQIGTASDLEILPPKRKIYWGLTFSPDGKYIYFNLFSAENIDAELYRVPSLGGIEEKIPNVSSGGITFSPDGKRIAFVQSNSGEGYNLLTISDTDGQNRQVVAKKDYPNTFYSEGHTISWSPDGNIIACLINRFEREANYTEIIGINPEDGSQLPLGEKHWFEVTGINWLKDGTGLIISAKDKPAADTQVWFQPFPSGEPRKITNDLNQYSEVNTALNGEALAAIQTNTVNGIFVGETGKNEFTEIASEVGDLNPVVWTPDGEIIFRSSKDGVSNLWKIKADGSNRQQITVDAEVDSRGLCVSPDGKYIVFVSRRSGKSNIWRTDSGGKNLTRLTDGEADAYPVCSPDNETVVFQRGIFSEPRLWKIPLKGGNAEQLTIFSAKWSAISGGGEKIAYFKMLEDKWRFGFITNKGEKLPQILDVPKNHRENKVLWTENDNALFYIGADGGVGNIWIFRFDGKAPEQITNFTTHRLADFSVSKDGKNLAVVRSRSFSDAVLIENISTP